MSVMVFRASWFHQATLYKFRYILGYGFVIALLFFVIVADVSNIPNGISSAEMKQAVSSSSLHFSLDFSWVVNLPYNFIQKVSVEAFGLSRLSLVLPSLIFGVATIVVFSLTMRHWFRHSVAVVATIIAGTSVPFISMLRSGQPDIMLPFWTILLLYGAVRLLVKRDHAFHWKLLIVAASLGLLYTPYGIYPLLAIFGSALFHPHVRSRLRHIKPYRLAILAGMFVLGLVPLIICLNAKHDMIPALTGSDLIRESLSHLRDNAAHVYDLYLNISKNGFSGTQVIPIFNLATLALALLGFLKSIRDRYTARSYVLLSWILVTVATTFFMPSVMALTFLPVLLLVAIGINALITEWYGLFPRNPYARVAGLIPLSVLFLGIATGNIAHYFNNHNHISNPYFSQSLPAIQSALVTEGNHAVILVTSPDEVAFYKLLQKEHHYLTVTQTLPQNTSVPTFVLPNAEETFALTPSRIVTSAIKDESATLRIYRPQ